MRVIVGWVLVGLAALLLVRNLFGGSSTGQGCAVILLALLGLFLAAGPGRGSTPDPG
jgi:hypothetical protein